MKKIFLLLAFCSVSFFVFAQNKNEDKEKEILRQMYAVGKAAIKTKNVGLMDEHLKNNPIDSNNYMAFFFSAKAHVLRKIHQKELRNYTPSDHQTGKIIATIMQLYKKSIDTCDKCALRYTTDRVDFLKSIDNENSDTYQSDIKKLKAAGYRHDKGGVDAFIQYTRGTNNWIGGGLSLLKFQSPMYFLKQINPKTGKKEVVYAGKPLSASFFSFAYNYDWANRTSDMNFSLFQFEAPFYLNLTKIGKLENAKFKQSVWYYRPEIGFGTGDIAVYYGYNVKFNKSNPAEINKHLITLKLSRIFGKN
jgi:hypothetical protein